MDKEQIRKSRAGAVQMLLDMEEGDAIQEMIARESGLFVLTKKRITRIRSPDSIDPTFDHENVPWEESLHLPHGSSDPFVARTILQTIKIAEIFFDKRSPQYIGMVDVSWEVMNSLISLRLIKERLSASIAEAVAIIEADLMKFTQGKHPKPLPIVAYLDIEFRSFANEVRRCLSTIAELFFILAGTDEFRGGKFDKATKWAVENRGKDSLLATILSNDQRWIKTWIDIRIAIEHPKKDRFVETRNFELEADRRVRLPTWRFVHPDYDMARPQNLLEVFDICVNNLLKFFEELQIALSDGHRPDWIAVGFEPIEEADRDEDAPMRFRFESFIRDKGETGDLEPSK